MSNPSIAASAGRIVLYSLPEGSKRVGEARAAIVTSGWGGPNINLQVLLDQVDDLPDGDGRYYPFHRVWSAPYDQEGKPGTWRWMDYQLGQAAKSVEAQEALAAETAKTSELQESLAKRIAGLAERLAAVEQQTPGLALPPAADPAPTDPAPAADPATFSEKPVVAEPPPPSAN